MAKKAKPALLVKVDETSWESFGIPLNLRHAWLQALLNQQGGINETVLPGLYDFNASWKGFSLVLSLNPHEE